MLGRTEGSRAEAGGDAPNHLLAHRTGLTPELLGAAQPETVKPEDPLPTLWCTQKPTKCWRGLQGTPRA